MANAQSYDELARRITDAYPELPGRLQGIARYVLGNPDAMALSTVAEIAREAQVPPSAVIRFANALGYSGFTELQRVYRERLVARSATYRDRIEEMRRTGVALLATALAVSCAEPTDLDRYIDSLEKERLLRMAKATEVNDEVLAELWEDWSDGAREWLRNLCLGIDEKIPR